MRGGYITNNKITVEAGYIFVKFQCGGGGIFLEQGSKFNMYGGYITSNLSTMRGGGICTYYLANTDLPTTSYAEITINGGFISSNYATGHEGGGINCDSGSKCTIEKKNAPIYISNNKMQTTRVWGGGGIYIGHTATLYIKNSLLTQNSADGLGGGYGSCTTADSFFYLSDGTAILTILQVERIVVVTVLTTNFMFILVRPVRLQLKVLEILRMSSRAVRQDYMPLCSVVEIPAGVAVAMVID